MPARPLGVTLTILLACSGIAKARTVVFWQENFPITGTQPISQPTLRASLGSDTGFVDASSLSRDGLPPDTGLLVMPYGSTFPIEAWTSIHTYLNRGGSLLVIGGQPFRVPVTTQNGRFLEGQPEDSYSRELGILHTYEAPQTNGVAFVWRNGYSSFPHLSLRPEKSFVLESHRLDGLAYILDASGEKISAPVAVINHAGFPGANSGARYVFLDFQPAPGFWDSSDGKALLRTAAAYALEGATSFSIELQLSTLLPGEAPIVTVHLRNALYEREHRALAGSIELKVFSESSVISSREIVCSGSTLESTFDFPASLKPGFYRLQGVWRDQGEIKAFYENGFWVEDKALLESGPVLGANSDFLTDDGKPFFVIGTNYFSTESNGWDFSGPRNAAVWEDDFASMEKHGVNFVRTGVWNGQAKFIEPSGSASERFLRNLEAYLLCAHRHHIAVNFTFFAFDPQSTMSLGESNPILSFPGSNPYLDPVTIEAEQNYMLSIVNRFKKVPYLSWDLINEPSFSNPHALWHGNTPNGDPVELRAWHAWLRKEYSDISNLAAAWSVAPTQFSSFDAVPLPDARDLVPDLEHNGSGMVRAYDYNLFAQDSFGAWVSTMVDAIRGAGSKQIIDVGQDEGGVQNRVLNQFFAHSGLSFTTNHTYRENQNLIWDSLAAKSPGVPNIIGETGYQPVTYPNGDWHFDEVTGFALIESKWAAGFAGGSSGFAPWDWDREIYFGMERSDGSAKIWIDAMAEMSRFAKVAQSYATSVTQPDVALILPQSLQLSVLNRYAVEAQQKSVLALYGYARSEAYAVGEDQIDLLGSPKLIIFPSPWVINSHTWDVLMKAIDSGSTLLLSGPIDLDPHFWRIDRAGPLGISASLALLDTVQTEFNSPAGHAVLTYGENKTDVLQRATLPNGETFVEKQIGKGKVLFSALPLELNDNIAAIGDVYRYALKAAGVKSIYSTSMPNPGLLISSTRFARATLYLLESLTDQADLSFRDERSGHDFKGKLRPGHSALLLISTEGEILASYNWQ